MMPCLGNSCLFIHLFWKRSGATIFFLKKIGLSCVCVDDWEGMVWERKLDHLRGTIDLIMGVRWWRCVDAEQRSQTRGRSHQNLNVSVEEANP
jgi:hypothetical protein